MKTKKTNGKSNFQFYVWVWDFNHDKLESYDVVPTFIRALKNLKNSQKPKTKEELSSFLQDEARYHFWSKCEYEMIIHAWPKLENDVKVDVFDQLNLNWDTFVDAFWNHIKSK